MEKILTPPERLIVAADFKPTERHHGRSWVHNNVRTLAASLDGTGVYLKVNSALRACGYDMIGMIHDYGLRVFADLKLYDISETLAIDGALLQAASPELLTTVCSVSQKAMSDLKSALPNTEVLGVTILTDLTADEVLEMYQCSIEEAANYLASRAKKSNLDGLIASVAEATRLRSVVGDEMTINTPAIRPTWAMVAGDDQNPKRSRTPAEAIVAGADRIVVGRPITQSEKPYDAVMRTIDEIASAVS